MKHIYVVLIDNYDSFTYNLYQYLRLVVDRVEVFRNDKASLDDLRQLSPDAIVISPGPKAPCDAAISNDVIRYFGRTKRTLGVCLGHQCINEVFGGRTIRAPHPCHGKTSVIYHDGKGIFAGLPDRIEVARYHSLVADPATVPAELEITAWTDDGVIMGLRHRRLPIEGVQFHPESFMTRQGHTMIQNFFAGE